jgi:hypothetical protein
MAYSNKQMAQLRDAMALLLPFPNDAIPYLNEAGVNWTSITLNGINPCINVEQHYTVYQSQ